MAVRVLTYIGLLYQDLIKSGHVKAGDMLPPVFPLVLYNGRQAWTARLDVAELIAPVSPALARYRPNLRYFLLDEGRVPDTALDRGGLAAHLIRIERSTETEGLQQAINALRKKLREPKYRLLNRAFAVWAIKVFKNRRLIPKTLPEPDSLEEVVTMLAEHIDEWTEQWKREGMLAGLQEGEAKGRMEGRVEGRSAVLSRQLAKRFGPAALDSEVRERLRTAGSEQLDLWAERILDAGSIDEVFAE
jgi:hypothetical protein